LSRELWTVWGHSCTIRVTLHPLPCALPTEAVARRQWPLPVPVAGARLVAVGSFLGRDAGAQRGPAQVRAVGVARSVVAPAAGGAGRGRYSAGRAVPPIALRQQGRRQKTAGRWLLSKYRVGNVGGKGMGVEPAREGARGRLVKHQRGQWRQVARPDADVEAGAQRAWAVQDLCGRCKLCVFKVLQRQQRCGGRWKGGCRL
jgi:hypothetical protein